MADGIRTELVELPANGAPMPGFLARPVGFRSDGDAGVA
jgi:hypothetical protein